MQCRQGNIEGRGSWPPVPYIDTCPPTTAHAGCWHPVWPLDRTHSDAFTGDTRAAAAEPDHGGTGAVTATRYSSMNPKPHRIPKAGQPNGGHAATPSLISAQINPCPPVTAETSRPNHQPHRPPHTRRHRPATCPRTHTGVGVATVAAPTPPPARRANRWRTSKHLAQVPRTPRRPDASSGGGGSFQSESWVAAGRTPTARQSWRASTPEHHAAGSTGHS